MVTCDMGFEHGDPEPPVVVQEVPDPEPAAAAAVEIARVEGDTAVQIAKINSRSLDEETAAELAALRAENEMLKAAAAPPEPPPVMIPAAPPEPDPDPMAPPVADKPEPPAEEKPKRRSGVFGF